MIGEPSASQDSSLHDDTTPEKEHGLHTPDIDDHPLRHPAAAHLPSGKNIEHEKLAPGRSDRPQRSRRNEYDPEKVALNRNSMLSQPVHAFPPYPQHSAYPGDLYDDDDDDDDDEEDGPKRHAVWILIYLSTLAPILALPLSLYTLLTALLLVLVLYPLRICTSQWPSPTSFHRLLSPPPLLQLGLICSLHETSTAHNLTINSKLTLVVVNVLSPIYAMAIAGAAWVAAVFWAYTAILGNPDGKEERDDGREAVLAVRRWWERWLVQGLD